jgi:hypothetical protein
MADVVITKRSQTEILTPIDLACKLLVFSNGDRSIAMNLIGYCNMPATLQERKDYVEYVRACILQAEISVID